MEPTMEWDLDFIPQDVDDIKRLLKEVIKDAKREEYFEEGKQKFIKQFKAAIDILENIE